MAFRLARQQILHRDDPTHLYALIDEAALRRMRGNRHTMRAQLRRIINESEQEHILIQVLPLSVDPGKANPAQFQILNLGTLPILTVALVDHFNRRLSRESEDDIALYRAIYNDVSSIALSEDESRDLIYQIMSEL